MNLNIKCTIEDVINAIKDLYNSGGEDAVISDNDWCLYVSDMELNLASECCIADFPEIDDDTDEETYPDFAIEHEMDSCLLPELVQDVVLSALEQKKDATNVEILEALNYYLDNDCFMEF